MKEREREGDRGKKVRINLRLGVVQLSGLRG